VDPELEKTGNAPYHTQLFGCKSTGNLDQMLLKVADVFEEEVGELVGNLTKLIEPLILVFLGGIIAFVLIAMYLPIFLSAGGVSD
jgi:type IV pilus assembly protein PilC